MEMLGHGEEGGQLGGNEQGAAMRCEWLLELRRRHGRSTASMLAAVKQGGRREWRLEKVEGWECKMTKGKGEGSVFIEKP